jgi:hypothetical protein
MRVSSFPLLVVVHYGKAAVCCAPRAHDKGKKMHNNVFIVCFPSGRTANNAR